jgi:hypothetical protein
MMEQATANILCMRTAFTYLACDTALCCPIALERRPTLAQTQHRIALSPRPHLRPHQWRPRAPHFLVSPGADPTRTSNASAPAVHK